MKAGVVYPQIELGGDTGAVKARHRSRNERTPPRGGLWRCACSC